MTHLKVQTGQSIQLVNWFVFVFDYKIRVASSTCMYFIHGMWIFLNGFKKLLLLTYVLLITLCCALFCILTSSYILLRFFFCTFFSNIALTWIIHHQLFKRKGGTCQSISKKVSVHQLIDLCSQPRRAEWRRGRSSCQVNPAELLAWRILLLPVDQADSQGTICTADPNHWRVGFMQKNCSCQKKKKKSGESGSVKLIQSLKVLDLTYPRGWRVTFPPF